MFPVKFVSMTFIPLLKGHRFDGRAPRKWPRIVDQDVYASKLFDGKRSGNFLNAGGLFDVTAEWREPSTALVFAVLRQGLAGSALSWRAHRTRFAPIFRQGLSAICRPEALRSHPVTIATRPARSKNRFWPVILLAVSPDIPQRQSPTCVFISYVSLLPLSAMRTYKPARRYGRPRR